MKGIKGEDSILERLATSVWYVPLSSLLVSASILKHNGELRLMNLQDIHFCGAVEISAMTRAMTFTKSYSQPS